MRHSSRTSLPTLRRAMAVAVATLALTVPLLAVPAPAEAAATSASRVAGFSAGPATVTKGKSITVAAQGQRLKGKTWVKTGTVTAAVYFDPDGSGPNKAVRTVKSSASGHVKVSVPASVSGKWSVRLAAQGTMKASVSGQKYVKVVPAAKPAPKPTSSKPASKWHCPAWAPIKGNAPSKIYHLKNQRFYNKTTPEICFSTETAAKKAGYRKSKV
ncbi:MAG: sunset domain-containing protein [Specibacter sp.]